MILHANVQGTNEQCSYTPVLLYKLSLHDDFNYACLIQTLTPQLCMNMVFMSDYR